MVQLVDIFAKPMLCLLGSVIQWFLDNNIKYLPESIFLDVQVKLLVLKTISHFPNMISL